MSDDVDENEKIVTKAHALTDEDSRSRARFPEVKGLCRTCKNALIRRRQYSEVPQVICQASFEYPHQVPLDIIECSDYRRTGEMHIREMQDLAIIIDPRKRGGQ